MRTTLLLFLILPICTMAQVIDDFSDGDFTSNPTWFGIDSSFMINNSLQLQSTGTSAGEAYLVIASEAKQSNLNCLGFGQVGFSPFGRKAFGLLRRCASHNDEKEWRFWIRESFSPSGNNFAEVWLSADSADLFHVNQGYFLRFGAAGSLDAIELFRKDPDGEHLICKGSDASIASSFMMAVKVNRDREGNWTVQTDPNNNGNYAIEAQGFDDTYPPSGHFGFYIKFTASNAKKFYFDDVYVGPKIIDTEPPELLGLEAPDVNHILLTFSESLDASALDPQNYHVLSHGKEQQRRSNDMPDSVCFEGNPSKVLLIFNESLPENTNLQLKVMNVSDLSGNVLTETTWDFSIYKALENDIVINEIMADPTPVVGLPDWEYIELFNTTSFSIDLKDWTLSIGNAYKVFPNIQIGPLGYLILCKTEAEPELSPYGQTCGFSSFSIANAGTTLRLFSPEDVLVSEVSFNDTWYHDADKKDGGWSLEQIDPFNPCAGTINWSASVDVTGGSPGRENSINAPNETEPKVSRISVLGDNTVLLWFDQQMDRPSLSDVSKYLVEELDLHPIEVICNPVESSSVSLTFDCVFLEGLIYTLILNGMESCSGHPVAPDTKVSFGIPNSIDAGDVLINEILFDPISPGVDYVELYNHSEKTFDLSTLKLGVIKESFPNPVDTVLKAITNESFLFMPRTYLLLSTDGFTVGQQYQSMTDNYLDMNGFPSFSNSGGIAILMSNEGVTVDQMVFSEKMHYPLLKETKGVSLERVSWEVPSDQADNWHSAAASVGFGTPGHPNSMMVESTQNQEVNPISIQQDVFSPDGDGQDDLCQFNYCFDHGGSTMNVYVFNAEGQLVRHLVKGELVGREGAFVWNGLDNRGSRVPIGLYVVVTEVFDFDGNVTRYKNAVAVASR